MHASLSREAKAPMEIQRGNLQLQPWCKYRKKTEIIICIRNKHLLLLVKSIKKTIRSEIKLTVSFF